jgi:hypothetical protein
MIAPAGARRPDANQFFRIFPRAETAQNTVKRPWPMITTIADGR